jgi:hypothetical protein
MGEAKRRRAAAASGSSDRPQSREGPGALAAQSQADRDMIYRAVRQAAAAVSREYGADCLAYAIIGAALINHVAGAQVARAVAGSAAWRVGPGDGDVISHAAEISQPAAAVTSSLMAEPGALAKSFMFHAWIELDELDSMSNRSVPMVVDFTTNALRHKAKALDRSDGGNTLVDWAPEYLWIERARGVSMRRVLQAPDCGVFGYRRDALIENKAFHQDIPGQSEESTRQAREAIDMAASAAIVAWKAMKAGSMVRIIGLDQDEANGDVAQLRP